MHIIRLRAALMALMMRSVHLIKNTGQRYKKIMTYANELAIFLIENRFSSIFTQKHTKRQFLHIKIIVFLHNSKKSTTFAAAKVNEPSEHIEYYRTINI